MMRSVTLVCGPPCAGKSTYVQQHAQPGDTILDLDDIAQSLCVADSHHGASHAAIRAHRLGLAVQPFGFGTHLPAPRG